jgi:putative mRNA 3-end processing factor
VITPAHADHFARGCGGYLVCDAGAAVFRMRLGDDAPIQTLPYGETVTINGVRVSLHPAGHILGSAQIRLEYDGYVQAVSGDYKIEPDRTCAPFEVVRCHDFITEATFGLPIYRWQPQAEVFAEINAWWRANADAGIASIVYCYALGKAQRVIAGVDVGIGTIFAHGAVERCNRAYREAGIALPPTRYASGGTRAEYQRGLIIAPISARGTAWTRRFGEHASAFASGWMRIRGARRRRAVDRGFILSDHADWDGLLNTVAATGAARIGVTHGYVAVMAHALRERGYDAYEIDARYAGELEDTNESADGDDLDA